MTGANPEQPRWTPYHAAWWALRLTAGDATAGEPTITTSIANARVDLNPHQVDAALFALRSPISRGVILADEVGLGKTIEAGLVISQRWAERRRRVLLVVPASLRTQWMAELDQKFGVPSRLLDRPELFGHAGEAVLVASYQFAAAHADRIAERSWDLAVFDEAHRLRNGYRTSSRIAAALRDATTGVPKLLLTATPLQNALIELYGLVSFIDPHVFGDEASFRARFGGGTALAPDAAADLRARLKPLVTRTLRAQVREYVRFTSRIPLTQDFTPTPEEARLYDEVSAWLQRPTLVAIPPSQRALVTLVLRRLLASSSFAIAGTLRTLLERLEGDAAVSGSDTDSRVFDALGEEYGTLSALTDEWEEPTASGDAPAPSPATTAGALATEVEELRAFVRQAEDITRNAKGDALLSALDRAFAECDRLGAPRKAVVFTESRRTQAYLLTLLERHGWRGQVVTLNGQNTDERSVALLEAWRRTHAGSATVTGSRAADTRAAIVAAFRNDATILVATEAASEGVNLQFCSLVVNYDLPWNPQRIEQRIGRCHRYGQQHDVVVLNLLNQGNAADRRVYELLAGKFRLFEGVFGASDDILGALENGVDIERRIAAVYQTCRTAPEIESAFDALQHQLEGEITDRLERARRAVLEHFDDDVHARLALHRDRAQAALAEHQRLLWLLTQHELGDAGEFATDEPAFTYRGERFHLDWARADALGACFYRPAHPLAVTCLQEADARALPGAVLRFGASGEELPALLQPFAGTAGWLECGVLRVEAGGADAEHAELIPLALAQCDDGRVLDDDQVRRLLAMPASVSRLSPDDSAAMETGAPARSAVREARTAAVMAAIGRRNAQWYDEEVAKLEQWSADLLLSLEQSLRELDREIADARRQSRAGGTLAEKLEAQKQLKALEQRRTARRRALFEAQDSIAARREALIEAVENRLTAHGGWMPRFVVRFSVPI